VKAILIVIAAFQYDAGAAATTAIFDSMELCEQARVKLEQRHKQEKERDGWGRIRMTAICAPVDSSRREER